MRCAWLLSLCSMLLVWSTPQALAFSYAMTARTQTEGLSVGDSVVVDVFFDAAQTDIVLFSVAVLADDVLSFDPAASALLPVVYPAPPASSGTTGSAPGRILYSPAADGVPEHWIEPARSPWIEWPGLRPPETIQLNIDYALDNILSPDSTQVTEVGIWIGSILLNVEADFTTAEIRLDLTSSNIMALGNFEDGYREVDFTDIQLGDPVVLLSDPILLTGKVPEPTTATLLGVGIAMAACARRRQVPRPVP